MKTEKFDLEKAGEAHGRAPYTKPLIQVNEAEPARLIMSSIHGNGGDWKDDDDEDIDLNGKGTDFSAKGGNVWVDELAGLTFNR